VSSQSARFVKSLATPGPLAERFLFLVLVASDVHVEGVDRVIASFAVVALVGGVARVVLLQVHLQFPSRLETGFAPRHRAHVLGRSLVQLAVRVQIVDGGELATTAIVRALWKMCQSTN
jgi:hypothetical protein